MSNNRKDDHIRFALEQQHVENDFDRVRFIPNSLPNLSLDEINLSTTLAGINVPYPFFINAMTGGSAQSKLVNEKLAALAAHFGLAIALGSGSIAVKNPSLTETFSVAREKNPLGIVIANLGAGHTLETAMKVMRMTNANILQIHINSHQEIVMPEGDKDFRSWIPSIKMIVEQSPVPVIVKEVGFGMSESTLRTLKSLGVKYIDVSGRGGTNFAWIENQRRTTPLNDLNQWGLSTVESLLEAKRVPAIKLIASGGVRKPLDVIKALALGADAVGMSSYFLHLVQDHEWSDAIQHVKAFIEELRLIMLSLGTKTIPELKKTELWLDAELRAFSKRTTGQ